MLLSLEGAPTTPRFRNAGSFDPRFSCLAYAPSKGLLKLDPKLVFSLSSSKYDFGRPLIKFRPCPMVEFSKKDEVLCRLSRVRFGDVLPEADRV